MSRRRPKPPDLPPGGQRTFTVKVVCTDRGQHARIVLHQLQDVRAWDLEENIIWIKEGRNGSPVTTWSGDGALHFEFRCPRCRRNPQLREENVLKILDALNASEAHPTLDISLLAC